MATLFDLEAVIRLDSNQFENGVKKAEKSGSSLATSLKSGLATAAKVGAAAVGAAATAIGALTTAAVNNYAEYEQLVGGVETLFKNSADTVMGYAENAYKTAGMSANEYMSTVTSFSAALLRSVGGDTEKAAGLADTAITDMSDNANKMGVSLESLQNAYTGFSRGNFTMLDNLALGFSGTKEGMQELLDTAGELSGVKYDISSYADIVEAIHVVQTEMGITGTTAKEASETISGSTAAMKSAWQNLLVGMADDNADFGQLVDNLVESAVTVGENIIPRVEKTIQGLATFISSASDTIIPLVVDTIANNLPMIISAGVDLVVSLAGALIDAIPELLKAVPQIILAIANGLLSLAGKIYDAGASLINKVKSAIMEKVNAAKQWGKDLIQNFIDGIKAKARALLDGVKNIAQGIKDFLGFSEPEKGPLSNFHTYAPDMMQLFAKGIRENEQVVTDQIQKSFNFRNSTVDGKDFVGSYTPSIAKAKASATSAQTMQSNTDTLLTAILDKLDGMGVYLDGATLTGYIDSSLGRKTEQNKRLALA